ncbi:MAG: mechanosensitive ion channel family protein, partial [Halomonas sp.]|nr:mechanosensitive ion channel family protein [Halomonas sp.]
MKTTGSWLLWLVTTLALTISGLGMAQTEEDSEQKRWFTVDAINVGLGEVPPAVNRQSPREAIRSFLDLTEKKNFAAAAHILNLSELPPEEQRQRGDELARKLAEVLRHG